MIIPDSIEPVIGWKALTPNSQLQLCSPQRGTVWPAGVALEAKCPSSQVRWRWIITKGRPETTLEEAKELVGPSNYGMTIKAAPGKSTTWVFTGTTINVPSNTVISNVSFTTTPSASSSFTPVSVYSQSYGEIPVRPSGPLLPDQVYVLECFSEKHSAPDENCACGIYIVDQLDNRVEPYLGSCGIVVKVAGWGKVIPGTMGWRVQYAYPQEIWIVGSYTLAQHELEFLQGYGMPIATADSLSDLQERQNVSHLPRPNYRLWGRAS